MSQDVKESVVYKGSAYCPLEKCTLRLVTEEYGSAESARISGQTLIWQHLSNGHARQHFDEMVEVHKIERTTLDKYSFVPRPATPGDDQK